MVYTQQILLVEDNQNDVELMLSVLEEFTPTNKVAVVRDGAEALDYLFRREKFVTRGKACLVSYCSILKCQKSVGSKCSSKSGLTRSSAGFLSSC